MIVRERMISMTTDEAKSVMKTYRRSTSILILNNLRIYTIYDYYVHKGKLYLYSEIGSMPDIAINLEDIEGLRVASR